MTSLKFNTQPPQQIPLDLGHRTAMGRDDFLVTQSNQDAVAWLDLWPDWAAPALVLYGPEAAGKTHLCHVWQMQTGAETLQADQLNDDLMTSLSQTPTCLVLDDIDPLIGTIEGEKKLFHLYNMCKESGMHILLTLQDPPIRRSFVLPDLASRLRAAPNVAIREPDDMLLEAVLVKLFSDRQIHVGRDVITYILPRIERSFAAAQALVTQADTQAMSENRSITIPFVRQMLEVK